MEFQDLKGTEEIQVSCFQTDPHLENLENQGNQDPKDLKESQGVQVSEHVTQIYKRVQIILVITVHHLSLHLPLSSPGTYCLPGAPGGSGSPGAQGAPGGQGSPGFKGMYGTQQKASDLVR